MSSQTPRRPSPHRNLLLACAVSLMAHGVLFVTLRRVRVLRMPSISEKLFAVNLAAPEKPTPTPRAVPTIVPQETQPPVRPQVRVTRLPHEAMPSPRRAIPTSAAPNALRPVVTNRNTGRAANGVAATPRAVSSAGLFAPAGNAPPDNTPRLPGASGIASPRAASAPPESESPLPGTAPRQLAVVFNAHNSAAPRHESDPPDATPDGNDVKEPAPPRGPRKIRRNEAPEVEGPERPSSNPDPVLRPSPQPEPRPQPAPVEEVFHRVKAIAEPKPDYPDAARDRNQQGSVQMRLEIDANGEVTGVTVTQSSGHAALDEAARRAAKRWKYQPARRGDTPVACSITRILKWTLED